MMGQLWAELIFYALGAMLFARRFPEKRFPGRFDYFLSSHNWLQFVLRVLFRLYRCFPFLLSACQPVRSICVLISCALHYNLIIEMYEWRQTQICPA